MGEAERTAHHQLRTTAGRQHHRDAAGSLPPPTGVETGLLARCGHHRRPTATGIPHRRGERVCRRKAGSSACRVGRQRLAPPAAGHPESRRNGLWALHLRRQHAALPGLHLPDRAERAVQAGCPDDALRKLPDGQHHRLLAAGHAHHLSGTGGEPAGGNDRVQLHPTRHHRSASRRAQLRRIYTLQPRPATHADQRAPATAAHAVDHGHVEEYSRPDIHALERKRQQPAGRARLHAHGLSSRHHAPRPVETNTEHAEQSTDQCRRTKGVRLYLAGLQPRPAGATGTVQRTAEG